MFYYRFQKLLENVTKFFFILKVPLTKEEVKKYVTEQTTIKDIQDGYMMSQEDYDRLHYEADSVKELKKAQVNI